VNEVNKVLKRVDYQRFYEKHILGFNANGKEEVLTHCPFHEDKNPSFSVNVKTGLYNCFSECGGGNAIHFIGKLYNIPFKEALQKIKTDEGITDTKTSPKAKKKAPAESPKKPAYLRLDQIKNIHNQLLKDEALLKKLHDKYGLSDEIARKYYIIYQNGHFTFPIELTHEQFHNLILQGFRRRKYEIIL
jgi:DNA primase